MCARRKWSRTLGLGLGSLADDSRDTPSMASDRGGVICAAGLGAAESPTHAPNTPTQAIPHPQCIAVQTATCPHRRAPEPRHLAHRDVQGGARERNSHSHTQTGTLTQEQMPAPRCLSQAGRWPPLSMWRAGWRGTQPRPAQRPAPSGRQLPPGLWVPCRRAAHTLGLQMTVCR